MEIIRGFANLPKITLSTCGRDDDVFVDRLNYKYSTLILFVSSITITIKVLQSDHIQCWVPAILSKYEHYINVYCWISNTYYVSYKEQTTSVNNKPERMLKYYQWVPLILLCLSFFFLLPRFFYRSLSKQSGIDLLNLADASINYMSVEKFDKRRRILLYLANSIHFYSICNKSKRTKDGFGNSSYGAPVGSPILGTSSSKPYLYNLLCCHGKLNGAYLTVLYIFTKLMYITNSLAQLFLLNLFLGFNYNKHGFHALRDITRGLISNTKSLQQEADLTMNLNGAAAGADPFSGYKSGPAGPIMGPTVIFDDTVDTSQGNKQQQYKDFGTFSSSFFSDTIYSEPTLANSMLHRYFPRESACDFRIRANIDSLVHNYTVQCVLPINLYNEQLFTLLWAWLWIVVVANCYDLVLWVLRIMPNSRYNYIRSRIRLKYSESSLKRSLNSFVYDYLAFDGIFILRIMTLSMSDCVTHEIIQTLWQNYTEVTRGGRVDSRPGGSGQQPPSTNFLSVRDANNANKAAQINQRYSMRHASMSQGGGGGGNSNGNGGNADTEYDQRYASIYVNVENI